MSNGFNGPLTDAPNEEVTPDRCLYLNEDYDCFCEYECEGQVRGLWDLDEA